MLRRIFGPKRGEAAGGWTKLHSGDLHNFYISLNIVRMIKSRRLIWAGHVARMGDDMRNAYCVLVGKPKWKTTRKTYA
jgi:hypothetical protein